MNFTQSAIIIALVWVTIVPAIRRTREVLIPLRCLAIAAVVYFGLTAFGLGGSSLALYFAFVLVWMTVEDLTWLSYLDVRTRLLPSPASEPDKRVRPFIQASIASAIGVMVAFPLFFWFWLGDMASKMEDAGLADAALSARSMMTRQIAVGVIVPLALLLILIVVAKKSPYTSRQLAFAKAMWAIGDRRRDLLETVVRIEQDYMRSTRGSDVEQGLQPDILGPQGGAEQYPR